MYLMKVVEKVYHINQMDIIGHVLTHGLVYCMPLLWTVVLDVFD